VHRTPFTGRLARHRQARCDWLCKDDTMTNLTMTTGAITSTEARPRPSGYVWLTRSQVTVAAVVQETRRPREGTGVIEREPLTGDESTEFGSSSRFGLQLPIGR
jgi:hypothetical protein